MTRITREKMFIEIVQTVAKRSTCNRPDEIKGHVGAILVRDGRIISTGYAGAPKGLPHCLEVGCQMEDGSCIRTIHAEANTIAFAAKYGIKTEGSTLYCTLAPCINCAKLIINSGIREVVYITEYRKSTGVQMLIDSGILVRKWEDDHKVS